MAEDADYHVPVTYERCDHVERPFFHGTKAAFEVGDELVPGYGSDFQQGRTSNNIYVAAAPETAVMGSVEPSCLFRDIHVVRRPDGANILAIEGGPATPHRLSYELLRRVQRGSPCALARRPGGTCSSSSSPTGPPYERVGRRVSTASPTPDRP